MKTTLNAIRADGPCADGWGKLLRHLGKTAADDEPLSIATVLDSNGLDDALWCLRAVEARDREIRLYAVWAARQVQHLMTDPRSVTVLDVAERHARGKSSSTELREAAVAAARAVRAVAADEAAGAAAWATDAAVAADEAAGAAAWALVRRAAAPALAAAAAALAAAAAAAALASWTAEGMRMAAYTSSRDAAKAAQADELRRICQEIEAGRDPYPEEDGR